MLNSHFYCPNPKCSHHTNPDGRFYRKSGFYDFQSRKIQRYKCKNCFKTFTQRNFELDYRFRKRGVFEDIFQCSSQGLSNRAIARKLKMSESSIRNRLKHLSRQSLLKWEELQQNVKIEEDVCFDGFETFVYSQFDPNNINHLVGKDSFFLYDFNYSYLNRKGRMTLAQKRRLIKIDQKYGRYPSDSIFKQSKKIFTNLRNNKTGRINLFTDEHKSYQKALYQLNCISISQHKTNSKEYRGASNPLFPVNHLDMKLRHFLKSCTRETIGFNKNEFGLMDRYIIHGVQKNFLRTKFLKHGKNRETKSPAMLIGIANKLLSFKEFFNVRKTRMQVKLRDEWNSFYQRISLDARYKIEPYCGI